MDESEDDCILLEDSALTSSSEDENDNGEQSEEKKSIKRTTRKRVTPHTPSSSRKTSAQTPNKTVSSKYSVNFRELVHPYVAGRTGWTELPTYIPKTTKY